MNNGEIEREREEREKPGEGQKPAECHVKCTPYEGRMFERERERENNERRNKIHLS